MVVKPRLQRHVAGMVPGKWFLLIFGRGGPRHDHAEYEKTVTGQRYHLDYFQYDAL